MNRSRFLGLAAIAILSACTDGASSPSAPLQVSLAKGGGSTTHRVDFTITDGGMSLVSDGKGTYADGICGVGGSWADILFLAPASSSPPKSQKALCAGIAPRRATVALAVKHLSDNPHVDDAQSPAGGGVFEVANVKFGPSPALTTTINATTQFCGTIGLRYSSVAYPGSSDAIRDDLGGGLWHMYSRPWPDNKAYCAKNGVVAFWHVPFDLYVQVKP